KIIAIADIQSEDVSNFTQAELETAKMVAAQLGQTLERLRQVSSLQQKLVEQEELLERQRERLLQYEYAERQATTDTWREYLQNQGVEYLGYDMPDMMSEPVEAKNLPDEIQSAIQTGEITVQQDGNFQ